MHFIIVRQSGTFFQLRTAAPGQVSDRRQQAYCIYIDPPPTGKTLALLKSFDLEIISGSRLRSVWKLAWPLVCLNLVNGTHGIVDHILVGHFIVSDNNAANAAIGVAWQVFLVLVVFITSVFHGMNVLISRNAGRQDRERLSRVFYTAFMASFVALTFIFGPVGYLLAPGLLRLMNVPPEVALHCLPYLRVLFVCGTPLFLMFLLTGAFHASGDPKLPLKLGVLTTVLNIVISTVLSTGLGIFTPLGIRGAAFGTVLAPMVSGLLGIRLIYKRRTIIQPPERHRLMPDMRLLITMMRIGIPSGLQGVLLNIGGVMLLWYISLLEYSAAAQAAYIICYTQLFSLVSWISFGLRGASGTMIGQNIGAGNPKRGKEGVLIAGALAGFWAALVGILYISIPGTLLSLFNVTDGLVYDYAVTLLRYLSVSGIVLGIAQALTGGLQGAGATRPPMLIAFVTQIVTLLGFCQIFLSLNRLTPEVIWSAILLSHILRLLLSFLVFRRKGWEHTIAHLDTGSKPLV